MTDISTRQVRGKHRRVGARALLLLFGNCLWFLMFSSSQAAEHLLIVGPDLPGSSEEGGTGRDAEIVKQVLALCGYEPEFVIHPFGRHLRMFEEVQRFDAVMTVPLSATLEGADTAAYVWYQDGAFYNTSRISEIRSVQDLAGLHVVTFKEGIRLLELDELAPGTASVMEVSDLRVHSKLLFLGRVDVVLADGLIVAEVNRRLMQNADFRSRHGNGVTLRFAPIFLPLPYKMVFRDAAMAAEFEECFDAAYTEHLIYQVNERHIAPLQHELRYSYLGF